MLQVYTGNGKGKTTAAIGLAIRSLGAGHRVLFSQFMKTLSYSEQSILQSFAPNLILLTHGKPYFIVKEGMLSPEEIAKWGDMLKVYPEHEPPADYVSLIVNGLAATLEELEKNHYDLLVLDEINMALFYELLKPEELMGFLDKVPKDCEVVCTGRYAPAWLCEKADLVSEMVEAKHYYQQNVAARKGIED